MSSPKRHHFVPRAYLEGFKEPNSDFLNIYSKRSGLWRRQKANQVMVRNKYYCQSWVPDNVDENILEKGLGNELEPKGLSSLKRLVENPSQLTDDDTANIIAYIEFQRIRVPRQADEEAKCRGQVLRFASALLFRCNHPTLACLNLEPRKEPRSGQTAATGICRCVLSCDVNCRAITNI
ncbi:DUF4238 domain-containing protein [Marinobacter sp. LV10MA510-1]|uniref:DUF4238 domain-containing protein n=1 Tax=Marinobacter sp. LV10MA510-1 TaxID=1415567 RepID=UPI000BF3AAE0|nr:uncharacterized protein DUF4238 [Marinobacter sp. LV10MA510-1]